MSAIAPTGGQTALGTPPVATPTALMVDASETDQAAIVGNIVTGTVIGRDARGAVELRTQNGLILLHTNARLPVGATVTLQVQAVGAQLQAILLQVVAPNGRPMTVGIDPAFPHAPASAAPPVPIAGPLPAPVTLAEGPTVTAIVIGPPRPGVPQASGAMPATPTAPAMPAPAARATAPGAAAPAPAGGPVDAAPVPRPLAPASGRPPLASAGVAAPVALATPLRAGAPAPAPIAGAVPAAATPRPPASPSPLASAPQPQPPDTAPPLGVATVTPQPSPQPRAARDPAPAAMPTVGPTAAPIAGNPVTAAVVQAASASPTASLAYAATQAATTHLLPAQPVIDALRGSVPARGAVPLAPLPPGSAIEVRVVVAGAVATLPPAPGRSQLPATIVGRTPTGQGIVDTPAGRLAVPLPPEFAAAPVGTRLMLDVVAWRAAAAVRAPATHLALETAAVRPVVDTVADIVHATRGRVDPHDILPRPGPRLAQQLAGIAAALTTGDVADWLGKPAVELLERRGQVELVRRLEHDLYDALKAAPQSPDWHGLILPFVVGDALRPLRLYVRQRNERARDRAHGTRFVLECDHDELGALQLDGLIHERRIDLMLRSHVALPDDMRGDLTALFGDACGVMGYGGALEFQAVPEFPAMPRAEPAPRPVGVMA